MNKFHFLKVREGTLTDRRSSATVPAGAEGRGIKKKNGDAETKMEKNQKKRSLIRKSQQMSK